MNKQRILWLVRHGYRHDMAEPNWSATAPRPFDTPLASQGVLQAKEAGQRLLQEEVHRIFASPFLRAVQTASLIAEILNMPVHIESGLSEVLLAKWYVEMPSFLPLDVIVEQYPRVVQSHVSPIQLQYPETKESVEDRLRATVTNLLESYDGNLLLVMHGGSIGGLCRALVDREALVHTPTCCLIKLEQCNDEWRVAADGLDVSHLSFSEFEIRLN